MKFRFDRGGGLCEYFEGYPDQCLNYMSWATKMHGATKDGMKNLKKKVTRAPRLIAQFQK